MPREYFCRKCGVSHDPPTGKKCRQQAEVEPEEPEEHSEDIMPILLSIQRRLDDIENRETQKQRAGEDNESVVGQQESNGSVSDMPGDTQLSVGDIITPSSLRKDAEAMQQAAQRMAQIQAEEAEEREYNTGTTSRSSGKKSGSLLVAADNVKARIDWPHMYVKRAAGGDRVGVPYKELTVEEFVFGFLAMLKSGKEKWEKDNMLDILQMLMQDATDFSWDNARNFYQMIGVEVEEGTRKWTDAAGIMDMRLIHSRTNRAEKKEGKDSKKNNGGKSVPQNLRCCALYQRRACEQARDHPPFTHACAFCARSTGMAYRHPEEDCFRKTLEESKNLKKRE